MSIVLRFAALAAFLAPAWAFTYLQTGSLGVRDNMGTGRHSLAFSTMPRTRHGAARKRLSLSMHVEFLQSVSAIGAALPDTPLNTNLGVPSPVLLHQVLFLASNIAYFWAGAAILRTRESPKTIMGSAMMLIGVASCLFHYFQCVMPYGSLVTKAFCSVDSVIACSLFVLFGSQCWEAVRNPTPRLVIGLPLAFLCYSNPAGSLYTLTHALWHFITAYMAYSIVVDRNAVTTALAADTKIHDERPKLPLLKRVQWGELVMNVRRTWREVKRVGLRV